MRNKHPVAAAAAATAHFVNTANTRRTDMSSQHYHSRRPVALFIAPLLSAVVLTTATAGQVRELSENFEGPLAGGGTGSVWGQPSFTVGAPVTTTWYENHYDARFWKTNDALRINFNHSDGFRPVRAVWNGGDDFVRLGTAIGETLEFSFTFSFARADANSSWANGTSAPRFGVYNNGGTNPSNASAGNYSAGLTDDTGFWGCFNRYDSNTGGGASTTPGGSLNFSAIGDVVAGGSGVALEDGKKVLVNDTDTHAVKLLLKRTAADEITAVLWYDGEEKARFATAFAGDFDANTVAFWSAVTDSDANTITLDDILLKRTAPQLGTTVIVR
jgi:hypothetical protein